MVRALLCVPNSGFSISIIFKGLWSIKIFLAGEAQDEKCHCPAQHPHPRRLLGVLEERRLFALLERERVRDLLPGQCAGGGSPSGGMGALCLVAFHFWLKDNALIQIPQFSHLASSPTTSPGNLKKRASGMSLNPIRCPCHVHMFVYPSLHCSWSIILAFSHYNT